MTRETHRLARTILAKPDISAEEFCETLMTAGVEQNFEKWRPRIEAAHARQSREFKRKVRPCMLSMYASLGDYENARRFISLRNAWTAFEMFWSMDVLLALDMLDDAKCLARRSVKCLPLATTPIEQSLLIDAAATFFARTREWDKAITLWKHAPAYEPLRGNALEGIIHIHLARAFEAVERGLEIVTELKRKPDTTLELCLPGNESAMLEDDEKQLLKLKRGIAKILPEEARRELGISNGGIEQRNENRPGEIANRIRS